MDLRTGIVGAAVVLSVLAGNGAAQTPKAAPKGGAKPSEKLLNDPVVMEAGVTPIALDKHFVYRVFSHAPAFHSPSSMGVSATGDVFVSEDEYNTQADRHEGICRVKMLHDSNGNGHADRVTVFADHLNAPQGMTFVGDTLFVVHAPYVTAFRDTNGDGVADERIELITGLGPKPEGLVHHIPSGIRMGIDGWLYIAIGDKGIPPSARGRDGRTVSLMGGGIVRVRPDGTGLELFCIHTRNIFDVDIDPYMNIFTRDNTNDGDGWWSRLTQMQRGADIGYPSLYQHYADALIQPIADYGGGGATGGVYVHEPYFPGNYGDSLYTLDWARGTLYRHVLTAKGADFTATQDEFAKGGFPTGVDVDGRGRMYLCNWDRQSWGDSGPVGVVYQITPKGQPVGPTFPVVKTLSVEELVDALRSPSAVLRREAQFELLSRHATSAASKLGNLARSNAPLYARVAAIFTLEQLQRRESHPFLAKLVQDPSVREFALRALADRDTDISDVNPNLFGACLGDKNPRVREQAAIGLGRLSYGHFMPALVPLTGDPDQMVRHAAMQSLRAFGAQGGWDACAKYLGGSTTVEVASGALRTMRVTHMPGCVDAVEKYLSEENRPAMRREAIRALACLYEAPAKPDYIWWGTRPDTRGPYYKSTPWEQTARVGAMFVPLMHDNDAETAKFAIATVGLAQVKEAIPGLSDVIASDSPLRIDAAHALIDLKSTSPQALGALQAMASSAKFDMNLRGEALAAIGGIDTPEAAGEPAQRGGGAGWKRRRRAADRQGGGCDRIPPSRAR